MLGGQLTCLVFHWDWQALNFLELFPSLRKLEMICGEASRPTLKLPKSLSALSALQHLVLNGLPVKDLGPLGGCSQTLQYLDLGRCPVEDLAPLAACSQLQHLDLGCCPIQDLQPLTHCTDSIAHPRALWRQHAARLAPFWHMRFTAAFGPRRV